MAIEAARAHGKGLFQQYCPTAKGTPKWWDVIVAPIRDAQGEVVRFVSVSRDITERMQLINELGQNAADLAASDHSKREFVAMLAHELRNPLAPISNALQIMRLKTNDRAAVESASEMMGRQIGQMARLMDDLLDVSRISRGKIELRKGRIVAGIGHPPNRRSRPPTLRAYGP